MDNTLDFTQTAINDYLISKGMNPVDAVYNTMLDLVYLMEWFIKGGGAYSNATWLDEDSGQPIPTMKVSYEDRWYLLQRNILSGYPLIEIYDDDWDVVTVHPDHLDTVLCQLLGVPANEA